MLSNVKDRFGTLISLEKRMWVSNSVTDGTEFDSPRLFANNIFVATNNLATQHFSFESGQEKVYFGSD